MKVYLSVVVDDKSTVYESVANLAPNENGEVDAGAVDWMLKGMLVDALLRIQVRETVVQPNTPRPTNLRSLGGKDEL